MRIIYMGTPEFSIQPLVELAKNHEIIAIYTQEPRPAKRGLALQKSPVHLKAEELGIPVYHPKNFKSAEDIAQFENLQADCAVVCAYGIILPLSILNAPKYGCINIHASLLPKYRGADPIRKAIINDEEETGITIMKMDIGMDTGDMLAMEKISIDSETTFPDLHNSMSDMGAYLINEVLDNLDTITPIPQDNYSATYAPKLTKEETKINWSEDAFLIDRKVRAFTPIPSAYFENNGKRYKVISSIPMYEKTNGKIGEILNETLKIKCGKDTVLQITTIQPEGKAIMTIADFLRGNKIEKDTVL